MNTPQKHLLINWNLSEQILILMHQLGETNISIQKNIS